MLNNRICNVSEFSDTEISAFADMLLGVYEKGNDDVIGFNLSGYAKEKIEDKEYCDTKRINY